MSRGVRRFEILLSLCFNDGTPVPDRAIADTLLELEQHFGALSCDTQGIHGQGRYDGQNYRGDLIRVSVMQPMSRNID